MKTAEIYQLPSAIAYGNAKNAVELFKFSKIFNDELASLLEQGLITEAQIKEVSFPSWEEMQELGKRMRIALLTP